MKRYFLAFLLLAAPVLSTTAQTGPMCPEIIVSPDIRLIKISEKAYIHVSVAEMSGFGKVSSNGLVLVGDGQSFLFDTPVMNGQTEELVRFVADSLRAPITVFVPNHWHGDCMGGLEYLHPTGVRSYAHQMTIDIAREKGLPLPQTGFTDSLVLRLDDREVLCYYPGAAHALDNIVVWIPSEKILFAGCMAKEIASGGLGNTADGDVKAWPQTIQHVIDRFPEAEIIIPGHGKAGNRELLFHTLRLCRPE